MIRKRNPLKKHAAKIGFGVAITASVIFSIGDMRQKVEGFRHASAQANESMFQQFELEASTEAIARQQKISEQRVKQGGCTAMVDSTGAKLATLQEGEQALNRGLTRPLAPNTCVIGANGETAIIGEGGVITLIAAGKPEYAQQAIRRVKGAKTYYYYPEIKGEN